MGWIKVCIPLSHRLSLRLSKAGACKDHQEGTRRFAMAGSWRIYRKVEGHVGLNTPLDPSHVSDIYPTLQ